MELPSGKRLLLIGVAVSLSATAAIAIAVLLFGDFGETEGRVLATTALVSVFGLLALPGAILLDQRRLLPLAAATLALAAAAFVVAQLLLWAVVEEERWSKAGFTLVASLVAAAHVSALSSRLRPEDSRTVRSLFAAGTALVAVAATMFSVAIWREIEGGTFWRLVGALVVAAVLATALQPVLRRMAAPADEPAHRLRLTLSGGRVLEVELRRRHFADAVASAVREAEGDGSAVERIERLDLP